MSTIYNLISKKGPTLLLVKSTIGKRFGGFTTLDWELKDSGYYKSND